MDEEKTSPLEIPLLPGEKKLFAKDFYKYFKERKMFTKKYIFQCFTLNPQTFTWAERGT